MKTIITLTLILNVLSIFAQDRVYVHTSTTDNTDGPTTYLDHPELNGNPGTGFFFTHNLDGPNSEVRYHDTKSGAFYDETVDRWGIFNEDTNINMEVGVAFNIYLLGGGDAFIVQADGSSHTFPLSFSSIFNDPNAVIVSTNYLNVSYTLNPFNYGLWYDDVTGFWHIYNEAVPTNIPANAAFFVLGHPGTGGATAFYHQGTPGNTTGNFTTIDHPSLNGNPQAYPIIGHNWGATGDNSNVVLDKNLGVWYNENSSKWTIFTEDVSDMPDNAKFNIYVAQSVLATETPSVTEVRVYPNPAHDVLKVQASQPIGTVEVFNVLGQLVSQFDGEGLTLACDISGLAAGSYIAKITSGTSIQYKKIVKR
jgi:hypothetical protein